MVEEMLAIRGITVSHETVRQWSLKFGREIANGIRRRAPRRAPGQFSPGAPTGENSNGTSGEDYGPSAFSVQPEYGSQRQCPFMGNTFALTAL
jgi:hypothetical protein